MERAIHFRDRDGGGCSDEAESRDFREMHGASVFDESLGRYVQDFRAGEGSAE